MSSYTDIIKLAMRSPHEIYDAIAFGSRCGERPSPGVRAQGIRMADFRPDEVSKFRALLHSEDKWKTLSELDAATLRRYRKFLEVEHGATTKGFFLRVRYLTININDRVLDSTVRIVGIEVDVVTFSAGYERSG